MAVKKLSRGILPRKQKIKNVVSTIYISPSTPFVASSKNVDKRLTKAKSSRSVVAVIGMGRAIQTVMQIAAALQDRSYRVDIYTLTLTAVDEIVDEENGTAKMLHRNVPAVELIIKFPAAFG